ncbi:MAG: hypothetical protein IJ415_01615 [Clostridia bacterium]|nr:hypothetical protein [Clostridia bacterium]
MAMQEFENEYVYKVYLQNLFEDISKDKEYNVFLHCVTTATKYFSRDSGDNSREIEFKVKSILKNGLDLDGANSCGRYGSIRCTAKPYGEASKIDNVESILRYNYLSHSRLIHSIILLVPKYIHIDNEHVEFSSFGEKLKTNSQHDKTCWFDIVKDTFAPTEFTLGYQVFDSKTQTFKLLLNENHFAFCGENKQAELEEYFAKKIKKEIKYCKEMYGIDDLKNILIKKSEEHMRNIDDFLMDP